jgi:tRNA (guanosine-2'-O-)-methyltransferase
MGSDDSRVGDRASTQTSTFPCIPPVTLRSRTIAKARAHAVELGEHATPLPLLEPPGERTVILLGHEPGGVPGEAWDLIDEVVEVPMIGQGTSLGVVVAASLVTYGLPDRT